MHVTVQRLSRRLAAVQRRQNHGVLTPLHGELRLLIPPNEMIPSRRCRAYRATAHLQTLAASSCRSFTDPQLLSLSRRGSPPLLRARRSAPITLLQSAAKAAPSALQPASAAPRPTTDNRRPSTRGPGRATIRSDPRGVIFSFYETVHLYNCKCQ